MSTEFYLKDSVSGEEIILCDYSDAECIAALQEEGYYMLSPERYGDKYDYPAVYTPPGIVWDQSEENKTNGDWTMMSREIDSGDGDHDHSDGDHNHGGDHDHSDGDHDHGDDGGNSDEEPVSKVSSLEYIIYNYKTHASYSVPDELSGSGFVLLNESTYPDYYHPAVYNTTTHTVIDQSDDRNTVGDWMMISKYNDSYTSSEESIDSIVSGDAIASFRLSQPVEMNDKEITMCIVGTGGKDKIIGGDTSEILMGGSGKNKFTGGANADGFMFDNQIDFGKKLADKINDFDSEEGDQILLDKEMPGLRKKLRFKSVQGRSKANKASGTKKQFIYDESKGRLYFNENGKDDGWGDGGFFAKLTGAPELDANDFMMV